MKNTCAIVIPFYGKLPVYFGYFLASLRGKCFDCLFFSDLDFSGYELPGNFKVHTMSFGQLQERVRQRVDPTARICNPYKICDFRPMFGDIFADELVNYHYWGFGDCDLVYGNKINDLIYKLLPQEYDIVTFRKEWTSGGFCLVKNSDLMRRLYLRSENWKEVVSREHIAFDEISGNFYRDLDAGRMTMEDCHRIGGDSFSALVWRTPGLRVYREDVICESDLAHGVVTMDDGKLRLDGSEIAIFHYVCTKIRRYFTYLPYRAGRCDRYRITRTGFYYADSSSLNQQVSHWKRLGVALFISLRNNGLGYWVRRLLKHG